MRILVTGANGYLGRGIIRELLNIGQQVIAADINTEGVDSRAEKIDCDIFEIENPEKYFGKPDVLLHLAWRNGFIHYAPSHIDDLPMHCNFVKKMIDIGITKLAVMGSMHEIGFFEGPINENTPCNPLSLYGISKNALRSYVSILAKQKDIKYQWLRGFYIVGNAEYGNSIFSKIVVADKEGKKKFPFTLGQNQYDFIDYEKFCKQVACTVIQNSVLGIINICSGKPEKLADRVERFISDNGFQIKLEYGAFPDRPYDSKAIWGDNRKISDIMNLYEKHLSDSEDKYEFK